MRYRWSERATYEPPDCPDCSAALNPIRDITWVEVTLVDDPPDRFSVPGVAHCPNLDTHLAAG